MEIAAVGLLHALQQVLKEEFVVEYNGPVDLEGNGGHDTAQCEAV